MFFWGETLTASSEGLVYLRIPQWAWRIIITTLEMDMDSSWNSLEIREEISRAVDAIEELTDNSEVPALKRWRKT
jgi:hypothetical protein